MDEFKPGVTPIPTSGATIGPEEKEFLYKAIETGWVTGGEMTKKFELAIALATNSKLALTCNSGSSANLLAVAGMIEVGYWKRGDKILCIAASFPTTINPLFVYGLIPVFVDITLPDLSVNMKELEDAYTPECTGVMIAHTLGIPYDMDAMKRFCDARNLTVVEDCCDALGSTYGDRPVGWLGKVATTSFFPAHHISTGEGGAVYTDDPTLFRKMRSIRDWGRDCWCLPGEEDMCHKRFDQQLGTLPKGYDHKYTYSTLGFNLRMPELPAAMGLAQLAKLDSFTMARRENFKKLNDGLAPRSEYLMIAEATPKSNPSWFGFPMILKKAKQRRDFQVYLEEHKIASRLIFGGNLCRQPYMHEQVFQTYGSLRQTERIMHDAVWVGVYPGLTDDMIDYMVEVIGGYFK